MGIFARSSPATFGRTTPPGEQQELFLVSKIVEFFNKLLSSFRTWHFDRAKA
jgi:hypothetical protein